MKNRRWYRLAGWLMTLVMLLTVIPAATIAEGNEGQHVESEGVRPAPELIMDEEADITNSVQFAYTDASGKAVEVGDMDPNKENRITLTVSGLNAKPGIVKETVMTVTLPDNITITSDAIAQFSNDAVSATLNENKLFLSWKNEKQDSFEATFAVLPHVPADNDLSGSYALITKTNVLVGATQFTKDKRDRVSSIKVSEKNGLIFPTSDERSVWTLKHISGNYYTLYSENSHKYLEIVLPNHATLKDRNEETAQKFLVQRTSDGYYTFRFEGVNLNNTGNNAANGFASYTAGNADNEKFRLCDPADVIYSDVLVFNINGGTGDTEPTAITADAGTKVTLPDSGATKNGNEFIGWCEVNSVYQQVAGTKHTYHDVYKPGTSYTLKAGVNTLYAIYNDRGTKVVRFGIRKDGIIQDEPNGYDVKGYVGHFEVDKSILKETHWVIDIDSTKPVNGYYVENNVTANLNWVPSSEQIAEALQKEGKIDFDPETQYIHYYVIKCIPDTTWKIDGVIRNKEKVSITYDTNTPAGVDKTKVSNMPGSYQVVPGTDIMIGADENSTKIKRPSLNEYLFMGWNTKIDGSGQYYSENSTVHLTNNLYLYAQWASIADNPLAIRITSDWPSGKRGYVGAKITLTAELTGFDKVTSYTLQWQYTTDPDSDEWIDVPDAHELTYTYILNEETTHYTWRCVAHDIN